MVVKGGWWREWKEREKGVDRELINCSKEEEHSRGKEGGEEGEQAGHGAGETGTVEAINYIQRIQRYHSCATDDL